MGGPKSSVGEVLGNLAWRGVLVFGLIWRSQSGWLPQSEGKNAELARKRSGAGGEVLLVSRTRRRDLRLELGREHLGVDDGDDVTELVDQAAGYGLVRRRPLDVKRWYQNGCKGSRPARGLRPHRPERVPRRHRPWAVPVFALLYDPEERLTRDRIRRRR